MKLQNMRAKRILKMSFKSVHMQGNRNGIKPAGRNLASEKTEKPFFKRFCDNDLSPRQIHS